MGSQPHRAREEHVSEHQPHLILNLLRRLDCLELVGQAGQERPESIQHKLLILVIRHIHLRHRIDDRHRDIAHAIRWTSRKHCVHRRQVAVIPARRDVRDALVCIVPRQHPPVVVHIRALVLGDGRVEDGQRAVRGEDGTRRRVVHGRDELGGEVGVETGRDAVGAVRVGVQSHIGDLAGTGRTADCNRRDA